MHFIALRRLRPGCGCLAPGLQPTLQPLGLYAHHLPARAEQPCWRTPDCADVDFASPDVHYLSSITVSSGKVFAMFVKSPARVSMVVVWCRTPWWLPCLPAGGSSASRRQQQQQAAVAGVDSSRMRLPSQPAPPCPPCSCRCLLRARTTCAAFAPPSRRFELSSRLSRLRGGAWTNGMLQHWLNAPAQLPPDSGLDPSVCTTLQFSCISPASP